VNGLGDGTASIGASRSPFHGGLHRRSRGELGGFAGMEDGKLQPHRASTGTAEGNEVWREGRQAVQPDLLRQSDREQSLGTRRCPAGRRRLAVGADLLLAGLFGRRLGWLTEDYGRAVVGGLGGVVGEPRSRSGALQR
jgi:hypothetical protein